MSTGEATRHEVRVVIPHHLQILASVGKEIQLTVPSPVTLRSLLDELERRYPMLRGTVREHVTETRRPKVRFYADELDLTHNHPTFHCPMRSLRVPSHS